MKLPGSLRRPWWGTPFALVIGFAMLWLAMPGAALALDPGYASGVLTIRGESIALTHAYAWRHGTQAKAASWSILLTDREVPIDLLAGPGTDRPLQWAQGGRLKGVLLRQQTQPPGQYWTVLPLVAPELLAARLRNLPLRLGPQGLRIAGDVALDNVNASQPQESFALRAHFSAPVFHDKPAGSMVLNGI